MGKERNIEDNPKTLYLPRYPDEWLTTDRNGAGGKGRKLEGDDKFSFR